MKLDRFKRRIFLVFTHDIAVAAAAWLFAYLLRFNFIEFEKGYFRQIWVTMPWVVVLQTLIFWRMGLYRGMWRFASLHDLHQILVAVGLAGIIQWIGLDLMSLKPTVPRSILVLDPILLLVMMGGSRLAYRTWKERRLHGAAGDGEPVLVVGTGEAAVTLLKELERSLQWRVVGLIDIRSGMTGMKIQGVPVLGTIEDMKAVADQIQVRNAIIALPSTTHHIRQKAVHACTAAGMTVLTVPSFDDLMSGKVSVSNIRKVEVEDLLGREPVVLDDAGLHGLIENRVVMVTGAGGSIGSELCRQIAKFKPSMLVLFEISEFALYQLEQELAFAFPKLRIACMVGDAKDRKRLDEVLDRYAPVVVFHAAAYKHVPMMENGNAGEALRNNVLGTYIVARACIDHHVEKFVLISTDKAVNPTNVMGATKRLAEMVCQGLQGVGSTKLLMVRFGNVLGSSGSVIPKFREQILRGGPVTVTHPEITRYFMSIPEAAQLVMQAGLMGQGGEIFVLDMGESVRIADLAREMIRLSGFTEDEIKISYTGLRPGEKLYEELLADDEHTLPTPHPKLRIAQARAVDESWVSGVVDWIDAGTRDEQAVKNKLREWVAEYQPTQHLDGNLAMMPGSMAIH